MTIEDLCQRSAAHARQVKEEHVRKVKGRAGRTDIRTLIEGFRGAEPAVVFFSQPDRDLMLRLAHLVSLGFSVDALAVTMETYMSSGEGPLVVGDLSASFAEHGPGGRVKENLMTLTLNRAGDIRSRNQPYVIEGRSVTWLDVEDFGDGNGILDGIVPNALRKMMAEAPLAVRVGRAAEQLGLPHLDYERRQFHMDMGAIRRITDELDGEAVDLLLFARPGSVRHQLLRERVSRSMIFNPDDWT